MFIYMYMYICIHRARNRRIRIAKCESTVGKCESLAN